MAYQIQFRDNLHNFIKDLDRYHSTVGTKCILKKFDQFNIVLIKNRMISILKDNSEFIKDRNISLFEYPFVILPDVDISFIWKNITSGQKKKIWTYLNLLLVMIDFVEVDTSDSERVVSIEKGKDLEEFDPFVGVGGNDELCVDDMIGGDDLDGEESVGLASLSKMVGLDKMLGIENLQEELRNMNDEEIDKATESIKNMMGSSLDENSGALINNMLKNVTEELKSNDLSQGNPFENIMKIAESVASKMKPELDKGEIDMDKLFSQREEEGPEPGNMNPFAMIGQMMNEMNRNGEEPNMNPMNIIQQMLGGGNMNPMDMIQQMMTNMPNQQPKPDEVD